MSVCPITAYSKPKNNIRTSQELHVQVLYIYFSQTKTLQPVLLLMLLPCQILTPQVRNLYSDYGESSMPAFAEEVYNSSAVTYVNYHIITRIPEPHTMHV